jgi:hypothetical protein
MHRSSITTRAGHEPDGDLADLGHLSRSQLRDLWQKEVGEKPPGSFGREVLALGIAYVLQERRYGGLRKASVRNKLIQKGLAFRWHQSGSVARLDEAAWPRYGILPRRHHRQCGASAVTARKAVSTEEGFEMKLTDTQLVLLSAASQREGRVNLLC